MKSAKAGKTKDVQVEPVLPKVEEVVPSLQNDIFMKALLAVPDVFMLPKHIASALGLGDYHVNLQSSVLVDFHFNNLMFAAEHGFSARAACVFMEEMEQLRQAVVRGDSVGELALSFKERVLAHLKEPEPVAVKIPTAQPEVEEAKPLPKKAPPKKGKPDPMPTAPPEPDPPPPPEFVQYTISDVADITEYSMASLLQHQKLFMFVFGSGSRPGEIAATLPVFVETAVIPVALHKALPEAAFLEAAAKQLAEEHTAIAARAEAEEQKNLAAQKAAALNQEVENKRLAALAAEQAHTLQISNADAASLVDSVNSEITKSIEVRQKQILARIDALIEKLGVQ